MTFEQPAERRYFEDYVAGAVHEFGAVRVEHDDVIDFGRRFDPQDFHVDPERARDTAFGGLIASGWHTAGLMMRLYVEHFLSRVASLGSPGIDELRWLRPVRPGDELRVRAEILDTRRSRSKPDRGAVRIFIQVFNQHDEAVMHMTAVNLFRCREETRR